MRQESDYTRLNERLAATASKRWRPTAVSERLTYMDLLALRFRLMYEVGLKDLVWSKEAEEVWRRGPDLDAKTLTVTGAGGDEIEAEKVAVVRDVWCA